MKWTIPEWRRREWRETMALVRSGPPIRLSPRTRPDPSPPYTGRHRAGGEVPNPADWMMVSEAKTVMGADGSIRRVPAQYTYWG